jgi:hypothetical protein
VEPSKTYLKSNGVLQNPAVFLSNQTIFAESRSVFMKKTSVFARFRLINKKTNQG